MKYDVLKTFKDKHTKKLHLQGAMYDTDNAERAEELIGLGFLQGQAAGQTAEETEISEKQTTAAPSNKKQAKEAKKAVDK